MDPVSMDSPPLNHPALAHSLRSLLFNHLWSFLFFLQLFIQLSEGYRKCHSASPFCRHLLSNSVKDKLFVCPSRGHFPYNPDNQLFYKCKHQGSLPCLCRCPLKEMYFNRICKQCKFSFLTDEGNCSNQRTQSPVLTYSDGHLDGSDREAKGIFIHQRNITRQRQSGVVLMQEHVNQLSNKSGNLSIIDIYPSIDSSRNNGKSNDVHSNNRGVYKIVTADDSDDRRAEGKTSPKVFQLRDPSSVPAWAIAFIVFGLVLIMVAIILIIY